MCIFPGIDIDTVIKVGSTLAGLAIAAYLAHWFTAGRAQRAGRNKVAARLSEAAQRHRRVTRPGLSFARSRDLETLLHATPWLGKGRVRKSIDAYNEACEQGTSQDALGQLSYLDPERVKRALDAIAPHLKHR